MIDALIRNNDQVIFVRAIQSLALYSVTNSFYIKLVSILCSTQEFVKYQSLLGEKEDGILGLMAWKHRHDIHIVFEFRSPRGPFGFGSHSGQHGQYFVKALHKDCTVLFDVTSTEAFCSLVLVKHLYLRASKCYLQQKMLAELDFFPCGSVLVSCLRYFIIYCALLEEGP